MSDSNDISKRMSEARADLEAARARREKAPCPHCSTGSLQPVEPERGDSLRAIMKLEPYCCDHCKKRSYLKKK